MLTSTEIQALTPEERTQLFDSLVMQRYGGKAVAAYTELGISHAAYFRWRREHSVPVVYILLLQEWLKSGDDKSLPMINAVRDLIDLQEKVSKRFADLITLLDDVRAKS